MTPPYKSSIFPDSHCNFNITEEKRNLLCENTWSGV